MLKKNENHSEKWNILLNTFRFIIGTIGCSMGNVYFECIGINHVTNSRRELNCKEDKTMDCG